MKFREVNEKKDEEISLLETKLRQEFAELKMKARLGQLREIAKPGNVRRDIARVLTVRQQRKGEL